MADRSQQYVYLPIVDALKCTNMQVNLFGAVSQISKPKHSQGTDYVLTLKIVDQSYSAPGLTVNFFAENTSNLPHVRSHGDVISLHRVVMKIHEGGHLYCVFNKNFSSFALFEGTDVGSLPYQTSAKYHITDHDDQFLLQLRSWLVNYKSDAGLKDDSVLLKSLKIGHVFDLVCKVCHISKTAQDDWMLFVWDGTDAPPESFEMDLDEGEIPCPLHPEEMPLSRETLRSFPHVGTVLRITASKFMKGIPHLQDGGHWVRLCNINCELQSGMWKGVLQPSSKVRLLADEDITVLRRERLYKDRIASMVESQPSPRPSNIIEIDWEQIAYSTLRASLAYPEVLHQCMCVVRVVAAYPWPAKDLYSPVDGQYRVRLTLEDPTARIHAFICKKDGEYFFGGHPPSDALTNKMNKLLGITDDGNGAEGKPVSRNPPWVWCCLKSYYKDKNNPWESRRYRIIASKLVG